MGPNHMNWHRFTLLHHMAAEGEIAKASSSSILERILTVVVPNWPTRCGGRS